jgi:hypothetical protein
VQIKTTIALYVGKAARNQNSDKKEQERKEPTSRAQNIGIFISI